MPAKTRTKKKPATSGRVHDALMGSIPLDLDLSAGAMDTTATVTTTTATPTHPTPAAAAPPGPRGALPAAAAARVAASSAPPPAAAAKAVRPAPSRPARPVTGYCAGTKRSAPPANIDSTTAHQAAVATLNLITQGAQRSPALTEYKRTILKLTELVPPAYFSLSKYSHGARNAVVLNVHLPGLLRNAGATLSIRGLVVVGSKVLLKHPTLAAQIYRLVMGRGKHLSFEEGLESVLEQMAAFTTAVCGAPGGEPPDPPDLPHSLHHLLNMPTPNLVIQPVKTGGWQNICSQMTLAAVFGVASSQRREGGLSGSNRTALKGLLKTVSSSSGCSSVLDDIADMMGGGDVEDSDDNTPAAIALRTIAPRRTKAAPAVPLVAEVAAAGVRFRKAGVLGVKAKELAMRPDFSMDLLQIPRDCKHIRRVVTALKCPTCRVCAREACLSCHAPCIACRSFSSTTDNPALDRHLPPPASAAGDSAPLGDLRNSPKKLRNSSETPLPGAAAKATAASTTPAADAETSGDGGDDEDEDQDDDEGGERGGAAALTALTVAVEEWVCPILVEADLAGATAAPWLKSGRTYPDVVTDWHNWLAKQPGASPEWLWLRERLRPKEPGLTTEWARPDVALNYIALYTWRLPSGQTGPASLVLRHVPMKSTIVPGRWNGTVAHLRAISESAPWYGEVYFEQSTTGSTERPMTRKLFLTHGSSVSDWCLRNITATLPFIAYVDPTLFLAPSPTDRKDRVVPERYRTIEVRCGSAARPSSMVVSLTMYIRLSCAFLYRGERPPLSTDRSRPPIILYCPYFDGVNADGGAKEHVLPRDGHTWACAVLCWSDRMAAVIADSLRSPRQEPTSGEISVLQLLCSVAHQEYGIPVPQRILQMTSLRQDAGSNACTLMVAAALPYALASVRYNVAADKYDLGADFRNYFVTTDLRAAIAAGVLDHHCEASEGSSGAAATQQVTWGGGYSKEILLKLIEDLHRRFYFATAKGVFFFSIQGEDKRQQIYMKDSVSAYANNDLPYVQYMVEKGAIPPVPRGYQMVCTSFAMLCTRPHGLIQMLHRDGDGGRFLNLPDFHEVTADKTLRSHMKHKVSSAWGPWSFLVNPSNGTRRILVLDCPIPRGEFPTEQQVKDHLKYVDIEPYGWKGFPITTWHSGGQGPDGPTVYPVGSPVLFTTAWAVEEDFIKTASVASVHLVVDALKEYVHTAKHVDIFGRAPTETLRLAYVAKLLDMGITGVAGFGGGAFNAARTRVQTSVWQLSRKGATVSYHEEKSSRTEEEIQSTSPPFAAWLGTLQLITQDLKGQPLVPMAMGSLSSAVHPLFEQHPELLEDIEDALRYADSSRRMDIEARIKQLAVDTRGKPLPQWPADVKFAGTEPFRLALWFCPAGVCKGYTLRCTTPYPPAGQRLPIVLYTEKNMLMENIKRRFGAERRWSWEKAQKGTRTEESLGAAVSAALISVGVRSGVTVLTSVPIILTFVTIS